MEQTRLRVLFLANVPSPYRVEFFNVLGRECDLTVLYQLHSSAERDKKWTAQADTCYAQVYLKGRATSVDKALCPGVIPWLQKDWDAIVISGNTSPTELLAIAWCKLRGIPYCLEADGAFPGSGRGLKELIKTQAVRGAAMYLSTCRELDKYYLHYGAEAQRIRRYRFSSLGEADILPRCPSREEKNAIRGELGIREEKVLLSIGQFIPRKGIDLLLQAANGMDKRIGIYIIGGTPTEEYLTFARENDLTSRNAGPLFVLGGQVIHATQVSTKVDYGVYLQFFARRGSSEVPLCAAMPHNVTITGLRTEDIVGIHTYSRDEQLEVIDARYLTRLPKLTPPENKEPNKE